MPNHELDRAGEEQQVADRIDQVLRDCGRPLKSMDDACLRLRQALQYGTDPRADGAAGTGRRAIQDLRLPEGARIVVIADLHGDFAAFEASLRSVFCSGLPEEDARRVHVVLLGDLLDRGARQLQLLEAVLRLRHILPGGLTLLRGNHEQLAVRGEAVSASVKEATSAPLFVDKFQKCLRGDYGRRFARFLEDLPHFVRIGAGESPAVGLVHGGVPPEFLYRNDRGTAKCDGLAVLRNLLADDIRRESLLRSFLWGRKEPESKSRYHRPYPSDRFFCEDVQAFCELLDLNFVVRGHEYADRGLTVGCGGRLLTLHSTGGGAPVRRGLPGDTGFAGLVDLPRFLVIDLPSLGCEFRQGGEFPGLDEAVGVREVFSREVVLLLEPGDTERIGELTWLAEMIRDEVVRHFDVPFFIVSRERQEPLEVIPPDEAEHDPELDRQHLGRLTLVLSRLNRNAVALQRRVEGGAAGPAERLNVAQDAGGDLERAARCFAGTVLDELRRTYPSSIAGASDPAGDAGMESSGGPRGG